MKKNFFLGVFVLIAVFVFNNFFLFFKLKPVRGLTEALPVEVVTRKANMINPERIVKSELVSFDGAWVLESDSVFFGGISGARYFDNGTKIIAITDIGDYFVSDVYFSIDKNRLELKNAIITPLVDNQGKTLRSLGKGDIESVDFNQDGSSYLAYEGDLNGVEEYKFSPGQNIQKHIGFVKVPKEITELPKGRGIEALAIIPQDSFRYGGYLFAVAERGLPDKLGHPAWIFKDEDTVSFIFDFDSDYDVTDIVFIDNKHFLVLGRKFDFLKLFGTRIVLYEFSGESPGFVKKNETLVEGDFFSGFDNMEALFTARVGECGFRMSVLSDNNFSFFQKNLFFNFNLIIPGCLE